MVDKDLPSNPSTDVTQYSKYISSKDLQQKTAGKHINVWYRIIIIKHGFSIILHIFHDKEQNKLFLF